MRPLSRFLGASVTIVATVLALAACNEPEPGEIAAIRDVLARDTELGGTRNHAPEMGTLADAVRAYVANLDAIDFDACPAEFTAAFKRHRDAWESSLTLFERHDDLRGELHDLFEILRGKDESTRKELEQVEERILETWAEVEAAVRAAG